MAGAHVETEGMEDIQALLARLIERGKDLTTPLNNIGSALADSHRNRFDAQISPDGLPWTPLSETYANSERKKMSSYPAEILILTSTMRDTLHWQVEDNDLLFGSNEDWAATHQFGDDTRNIPARPFLGFSEADKTNVLEELIEWLTAN